MDQQDVTNELAKPGAQELLQSSNLLRLAYDGVDGSPRVIPIGFHWDGARIFVCTATVAPKVKALQKNPRVAVTIDTEAFPPHLLLIRGTAQVEIVDGVPDEFLKASSKGGVPPEQWDGWLAGVQALYKQMARISITPEWAKFMDFETSAPEAVMKLASEAGRA